MDEAGRGAGLAATAVVALSAGRDSVISRERR